MNDQMRAQIVRSLRAAADAIEGGADTHPLVTFMSYDLGNGFDYHRSAQEAECAAEAAIEPDDDGYAHDIGDTSWGLYVVVQAAHIDESEVNEYGCTPRDYGRDADVWWEVSLMDVWGDR